MKEEKVLPIRLQNFSMNIETCRSAIFDLRYPDLFQMTGIPESTMYFYDSRNVCPYISVANQIARVYCTTVGELCSSWVAIDAEKKLSMILSFLRRLPVDNMDEYKKQIITECKDRETMSREDLYETMASILRKAIRGYCDKEIFFKVDKDEKVVQNFTRNFLNLHKALGLNYRKISKATGISLGNFTRLAHGVEPMLTTVMSLADYFGIDVADLLADEPHFDYPSIAKTIENKTSVSDYETPVNDEELKKIRALQIDLLTKEQYSQVIDVWLRKE